MCSTHEPTTEHNIINTTNEYENIICLNKIADIVKKEKRKKKHMYFDWVNKII